MAFLLLGFGFWVMWGWLWFAILMFLDNVLGWPRMKGNEPVWNIFGLVSIIIGLWPILLVMYFFRKQTA